MFKSLAERLSICICPIHHIHLLLPTMSEGEKQQHMDPEGDQNIRNSHTQRPLPHTHTYILYSGLTV